ncbi:hypothetical protein ABZP36_010219 [Zizania latifolia]
MLSAAIQEYVLGEYDANATDAYYDNQTSESADKDLNPIDISKRYALSKRLFQQEKRTHSIHCNELPAEPEATVDDDTLPKAAQISIIPDPEELRNYAAYAT